MSPAFTATDPSRWSTPSRRLHAILAVMIVGLFVVGFVMSGLAPTDPSRRILSLLHAFGGVVVVLLTVVRTWVRRRDPTPSALPLGELHRRLVAAHHALTYAALFVLGATGALTAARGAWPAFLRGASPAPNLQAVFPRALHAGMVFVLIALLIVHIAGVLLQQVRGQRVLERMLPP